MRNLLFCPPLRTALAGASSKPACHGVLMLLEMCIAHIFCPPLNKGLGGSQIVHPCGLHRNAHGRAIRAVDEMHAPSNERLPFGGAPLVGCATGHLPTAPGAHPAANQLQRGETIK
jgi:hypothetical protein